MNSNQVYELMQYAVAKNIQQGYLSPQDFYTSINTAQQQYLDELLGEYQRYRENRPIPVVQFGNNERVRNSIAPLIYNITLSVFPYGTAGYPSDYEYVDAMWGQYGNYNIRFAQQSQLDSFLHSDIDPIADNPIYLLQHEGFHFYPETIGVAKMAYVRTPPSIVWGYLTDSNGNAVWNPATSQNPVWGDTDMMNIISRALQLVGVSLQYNTLMQYSEQIKRGGQ